MKKNVILTVVLGFAVRAALFSYETRIAFGVEYGNFFENRRDAGIGIETYLGSPGMHLSQHLLWDKVGLFYSFSFLFPHNVSSSVDGYEYFFLFNGILGPAFKIPFGNTFSLIGGVGFSLSPVVGELNDTSLILFNMGIGGDIGFSIMVNNMTYGAIGSLLTYHFGNLTSRGTGSYEEDEDGDRDEIRDTGSSSNYNLAGVRPYIRLGLKF